MSAYVLDLVTFSRACCLVLVGYCLGCDDAQKNPLREYAIAQIDKASHENGNSISLYGTRETDQLIDLIEERVPNVEVVALEDTDITIEGFRTLARLPRLASVRLECNPNMTIECVEVLARSDSLKSISYIGADSTITDRIIELSRQIGDGGE